MKLPVVFFWNPSLRHQVTKSIFKGVFWKGKKNQRLSKFEKKKKQVLNVEYV